MFHHHHLPAELWLEIFEWATYDAILDDNAAEHQPFRALPMGLPDDNLSVRVALSLVCRTWRKWVSPTLYRNIRVKFGTERHLESLNQPPLWTPSSAKYGDMVERIVLSYAASGTGARFPESYLEVLQACTRVHTLSRPPPTVFDQLVFDADAPMLALPSLRRLEWWHHNEAARSGGINSLDRVLRHCPNLSYLFVGGVMGNSCCPFQYEAFELPDLKTLRLHIINGLLFSQILSCWTLPSLTTLILDVPCVDQADSLTSLWNKYGQTLRRVEFGRHLRFLKMDHLSQCLRHCPNIEELNYYLLFTKVMDGVPVHHNLKTIGLNSQVNSILVAGEEVWRLVEGHLRALKGTNFSSLSKIVLYGESRALLNHPRFMSLKDELALQGKVVELPDGTSI